MIMTKNELNIEHRLVSIGARENHDKEQFNGAGTDVGLQSSRWVG